VRTAQHGKSLARASCTKPLTTDEPTPMPEGSDSPRYVVPGRESRWVKRAGAALSRPRKSPVWWAGTQPPFSPGRGRGWGRRSPGRSPSSRPGCVRIEVKHRRGIRQLTLDGPAPPGRQPVDGSGLLGDRARTLLTKLRWSDPIGRPTFRAVHVAWPVSKTKRIVLPCYTYDGGRCASTGSHRAL
jgi:hypothetical protein